MESIAKWFLGFLLVFLLLFVAFWIVPAPPAATGQPHPEFATLLQSGGSVADDVTVRWLAYCFGLGILCIFGFCLYLGAAKKNAQTQRKVYRWFAVGLLTYLLVYTAMVLSYWHYHETNSTDYFLGFPAPTAWMLYGMWPAPLLITLAYVFKFDDWVLQPEELEEFERIVAARRERDR